MTGYGTAGVSPATSVEFAYDANGNRTNKVVSTTGYTEGTEYVYDEDNRLIEASVSEDSVNFVVSKFAYDYRSRRYYRSTPSTPHMFCVFDGGLSIQEYEVPSADLTLNPLTLNTVTTEFIRGEGMGGGVGGMVYSIKDDGNGGDDIICSHANHRGDVIARSDDNRSLTSFALYEAYGKRPYEWGDDPDRQKANTKEEESDLGLLNEGMRYRDLETGTFLTRDPLGYTDGPNLYCYVGCNPITRYDAEGLWWDTVLDVIDMGAGIGGMVYNGVATAVYSAKGAAAEKSGDYAKAAEMYGKAAEKADAGVKSSVGLTISAGATLVPGVSSVAVKGGMKGTTAAVKTTASAVDKINDVRKGADKAADAMKTADKVADANKAAGKGSDVAQTAACFLEGTLVWTSDGLLPIEQIETGMKVLSYDFVSGALVYSNVTQPLERNYTGEIVHVQIGMVTVSATVDHPFWVVEGENLADRPVPSHVEKYEGDIRQSCWVDAGDLLTGDMVVLQDGSTHLIDFITSSTVTTVVYNMTVEGTANYYVTADGILVHNNPCAQKAPTPNNGVSKPHGKPDHDATINNRIDKARQDGATNIRKNQAQTDVNGNKVGNNRPDAQWDADGKHHNYEIDRSAKNSNKHQDVVNGNDPDAINEFEVIEPDPVDVVDP